MPGTKKNKRSFKAKRTLTPSLRAACGVSRRSAHSESDADVVLNLKLARRVEAPSLSDVST